MAHLEGERSIYSSIEVAVYRQGSRWEGLRKERKQVGGRSANSTTNCLCSMEAELCGVVGWCGKKREY